MNYSVIVTMPPGMWPIAAKAHHLYPRHAHFKKMLNRPGNVERNHLYMYMRHWTAGWLRRSRPALHKKLPYSFGMGKPAPPGEIVYPPNF